MNKTPSILVDTGFEVDQNGALTEIVIPEVVATCNAPRKVTFEGQTINYVPSTAAALQEFAAPNMTEFNYSPLANYTNLNTVTFQNLESINNTTSNNMFYGCTKLQTVNMPKLKTLTNAGAYGIFNNCGSLVDITFPSLETIYMRNASYSAVFPNCAGLTSITMPKIKTFRVESTSSGALCVNCFALTNLTLGSEGNPVTSLGQMFQSSNQSGLTITVYTNGGASLSGQPWGANNATIEYEEA